MRISLTEPRESRSEVYSSATGIYNHKHRSTASDDLVKKATTGRELRAIELMTGEISWQDVLAAYNYTTSSGLGLKRIFKYPTKTKWMSGRHVLAY